MSGFKFFSTILIVSAVIIAGYVFFMLQVQAALADHVSRSTQISFQATLITNNALDKLKIR